MIIHCRAGKTPKKKDLINISLLIKNYYDLKPERNNFNHKVKFGTSGHRGSSSLHTFNEQHVLTIAQAISEIRKIKGITGPCFVGKDTHALSEPAFMTVIEVLIANRIDTIVEHNYSYTPTPSISYAILNYNRNNKKKADGIIITPSHNPPEYGGIKYNDFNGGPANEKITIKIEKRANQLISNKLSGINRIPYKLAIKDTHYHERDFIYPYVKELKRIVNINAIKNSGLKIAIDPLGGTGINYWMRMNEYYQLNFEILNEKIDPTFSFMKLDYDGIIRIDCASQWSIQGLLKINKKYDLILVNDPDSDRHGIITNKKLINPNHYLAISIDYLFKNRPLWKKNLIIGKTLVSSNIINHVINKLGLNFIEFPVGFKWFSNGLYKGIFGFVGEESGGASFLTFNGSPWTTDKDGIALCLLAAEIISITGISLEDYFKKIINITGKYNYNCIKKKINYKQKKILSNLSWNMTIPDNLAGDPVINHSNKTFKKNIFLKGIKIITKHGWFVIRISGTEDIYKIYCESKKDKSHLKLIEKEAKNIIKKN
ncbi:MAG: phosphoglucomutase, alpha-D-glucose phosphate-specific [Arsenophonus sp.]|nr:MAG: phosphoglucomutase, alpha-D-glucose phosphate-specific [Arsenophonus sp.]